VGKYSIDHKTEPIGISTSNRKSRTDKSYFLSIMCSNLKFFTLTPETWEQDLKEVFEYEIHVEQDRFYETVQNLIKKRDFIKKYKELIDGKISKD
jgi:hypothetical protein